MNFKEYDEIIKKHKYDMLHFIIYYNLICDKLVENVEKILDGNWTKWDLLEVCYE